MIKKVDSDREDIRFTLNTLDRACFPADELCSKDDHWWMAYNDEGVAVGFAGLRDLDEPGMGYLCRVGVLWEARGNGLQKRFIRARLAYARKIGLKAVVTDTTVDSLASMNNLINCGFRLYGPANPWARPESLYWWRTL
jgi:RimJ/RimL family protein N-acetyltransferase